MLYKGWVPTVIGRLSFRSIGDTSFPDRSISSNITISDGAKRDRYIFAFQRRRLGDTAFPAITNSILGLNGSFYFTLASVSDDHEPNNNKLLGAICIFIQPNWSLAKDEARSLVRCDPTDVAQYKEQWATLTSHISRHADCIVNFTLFRNGNCEFSKPQIHSEAFQEMEDGDICNQAYSFLRDITHAHQHHDPSADTLLTVRTVAEDETQDRWKRHVMYSLVFYLVKARRRRSASAQSRMLGVIAYAKTFQAICGVDDMSYHLDNLVESITSKHQEYNARDMAKSSTRSLIYSIVLGASAILIALSNFISIRETKYPSSGRAMLIVDWLGRHADTIFAVVVLMAVFAVLAAVRPRIIETPFAKDATRVVIKLYSIIGGQIFFMAAGSILIAISFVLLRHVL